jgi:hypothetical protein
MDANYQDALRLIWDLVLRQRSMLELLLPTTWDVAKCMIEGLSPSPEQVSAWKQAQTLATDKMLELNAAFARVQQVVDPLIRFDA